MQIFVSFCLEDAALVDALMDDLHTGAYSFEWEPRTLEGAVPWMQIIENIEQSDVFLFTLTPNTLVSYSRILEYQYAVSRCKPILPVQLDEFDLSQLPAEIVQFFVFDPYDPVAHAKFTEALAK